jgi:site-specific recombinase XerD
MDIMTLKDLLGHQNVETLNKYKEIQNLKRVLEHQKNNIEA